MPVIACNDVWLAHLVGHVAVSAIQKLIASTFSLGEKSPSCDLNACAGGTGSYSCISAGKTRSSPEVLFWSITVLGRLCCGTCP